MLFDSYILYSKEFDIVTMNEYKVCDVVSSVCIDNMNNFVYNHASRITHHASRITHHASRITHHAIIIAF